MVIAVLMFFWLPESLQFLVAEARQPRDGRPLAEPDRTTRFGAADASSCSHEENQAPAYRPFISSARAGPRTTILLWVVNFMNIYNLYLLSSWLPTV